MIMIMITTFTLASVSGFSAAAFAPPSQALHHGKNRLVMLHEAEPHHTKATGPDVELAAESARGLLEEAMGKDSPPLKVSISAIFSHPKTSVESHIVALRTVRSSATISWPVVEQEEEGELMAGWLLEASVLQEAAPSDWSAWEPAATLPGKETSYTVPLEPGLAYKFRLAGLSDTRGQLPFTAETPAVSVLAGGPSSSSEALGGGISGCYVPHEAEALANAVEAARHHLASEHSTGADEIMPWDSAGVASVTSARAPPPAPSPADALETRAWRIGGDASATNPLLALVPTSTEVALLQAQASLAAAFQAGERRVRIELLPPGLNRGIEHSHAYSEPAMGSASLALAESLRGCTVQVIFPSAGTAAGAQAAFSTALGRQLSAHVRLGAFSGAVTRDAVAEGMRAVNADFVDFTSKCVDPSDPADVYLVAAPANGRGDAVALAVEQAVRKVPNACWVLLNPDLEDTILSYTFGIETSDHVRKFVAGFKPAFYYKGVFQTLRPSGRVLERGCLLHHHGGPWVAHGLCREAGGFDELASFEEKPSRAQVSAVDW